MLYKRRSLLLLYPINIIAGILGSSFLLLATVNVHWYLFCGAPYHIGYERNHHSPNNDKQIRLCNEPISSFNFSCDTDKCICLPPYFLNINLTSTPPSTFFISQSNPCLSMMVFTIESPSPVPLCP